MFGGLGGGLRFGGTTIWDNTDPGGNTMLLGGCWAIPLGGALMSPFFSSVLIGNLATSGVTFYITGWVSSTVGALA